MSKKMKNPKVLTYDIETCLSLGAFFSLGKQVVRHNQLLKGYFNRAHVMCITYKWKHEKKAKILTWGNSLADEREMIRKFDLEVAKADIVIGKNNNRFDNKHINTQRLWFDLPARNDWLYRSDDLEKQMRKYFYLPSYSLDWFSEQMGLGGKRRMEFSDWYDMLLYRMIQLTDEDKAIAPLIELLSGDKYAKIKKKGKRATKKMFEYGLKDTVDTCQLWDKCVQHFEPRFNHATYLDGKVCKNCGSANIIEDKERVAGGSILQTFYCKDHQGYAGRCRKLVNGGYGKML